MNRAIRSFRGNLPTAFSSPLPPSQFSCIRVRQVNTLANGPENSQDMETSKKMNSNKPQEKNEDLMSVSFGEGYATRSDEEGFGGIHGGNQSIPSVEIDKQIHENHPAYDKTQGSEVKEKEKARHQTSASN